MSIQQIEEKVRETSKATGRKTGSLFTSVWNFLLDALYVLAVLVIVSVVVYMAYHQGADNPAIVFFGEKVDTAWSAICIYFGL